jgi:hypothetical protein
MQSFLCLCYDLQIERLEAEAMYPNSYRVMISLHRVLKALDTRRGSAQSNIGRGVLTLDYVAKWSNPT